MKRRDFMIIIAVVTIAAAISFTGCESMPAKKDVAMQKRPNIIFLMTDDQRWDTMGCAGNHIIQTPNMDDMAQNGARFANAFVTTSLDTSSRASILTGQWTRRHGIINDEDHLSEDAIAQTYPLLLRESGYRTGFVGMYGMGLEKDLPVDKYDFWRGFAGKGKYENKDNTGKNKHLTQIIGEQAVEFLQGCTADQPFCLSVNFKAPQAEDDDPRQFVYDPAYKDLYKDVTIPTLETTARDYYGGLPEFIQQSQGRVLWRKRFLTPDMMQESIKSYYRLITGVDAVIGKIREQLAQLGLNDNTVIIFTSDNGFFLGEYGLAGKWFPHDVSIRVPLIILDPRANSTLRGTTVEQMALNVDIAPTIIELAGLDAPGQMQGQSLVPFLYGRQVRWRTEFYYENLYEHRLIPRTEAVRTEDFKYSRFIDYNYEELYDLKNDPNETLNVSLDSKYQRTLSTMQKQCDELARQMGGM